jgi:hypothetical protein
MGRHCLGSNEVGTFTCAISSKTRITKAKIQITRQQFIRNSIMVVNQWIELATTRCIESRFGDGAKSDNGGKEVPYISLAFSYLGFLVVHLVLLNPADHCYYLTLSSATWHSSFALLTLQQAAKHDHPTPRGNSISKRRITPLLPLFPLFSSSSPSSPH